VAGVFAVGAPIFINRVEDDLERRAVAELEAAGIGGVTPSFSGQDGELRCLDGPVEISDDVVGEIRDLWGVSSLDVDGSCTDSSTDSSSDDDEAAVTDTAPPPETDATDATEATSTTIADTTTTTTVPDLDPVAGVVANDSQFSTLTGLLADAGLTETLADEGPFTVFAPTNDAFEALGADVTGALARDPDLLATVLSHHVTTGSVLSTSLADGTIDMLDDTPVTIDIGGGDDADGVTLTSGDSTATVTEADLEASNGVVHAIDQVLIPEGLVIGPDPTEVRAAADYVDGQMTLRGTVASEAQREALMAAASSGVDPDNVIDELVVDSGASTDGDSIDALAAVVGALPSNLVSGSAELTGEGIAVKGVAPDEDAEEAFDAAVADIDGPAIMSTITQRAAADEATAAELEAELNALVAANPILFDQSSIAISDESAATLDRVAALANSVSDVDIEIQGYTDTDGAADSNEALSDGRAASVRIALVERGLDDGIFTTVGFGGEQPILDADGNEDKAASRRVEFVVTPTQ